MLDLYLAQWPRVLNVRQAGNNAARARLSLTESGTHMHLLDLDPAQVAQLCQELLAWLETPAVVEDRAAARFRHARVVADFKRRQEEEARR